MDYGKHLILLVKEVEHIERLGSNKAVCAFLNGLVSEIGMRVLVQPCAGFEDGDPEKIGYSGVVILYESHIAIHVYSALRKAFIDVFSCKEFDEQTVMDYLQKWCGSFTVEEQTVLSRGRHWSKDVEQEAKNWNAQR